MPTLADAGYQGAGIGILTPVKNSPKGKYGKVKREPVLTQRWAALQRITASPSRTLT